MPKPEAPATRAPLYSLHVDPANLLTASVRLAHIVAEAALRPHLRDAIQKISFEQGEGIAVLVHDRGQRNHLANALGIGNATERTTLAGGEYVARVGDLGGVFVRIWSEETENN